MCVPDVLCLCVCLQVEAELDNVYEEKRRKKIAENKAQMESLGLAKAAAACRAPAPTRKPKRKADPSSAPVRSSQRRVVAPARLINAAD